MKRKSFLTTIFGLAGASWVFGKKPKEISRKTELLQAWEASRKTTLAIVEQITEEFVSFKYTPEAMSFAEQFRHCAVFTFGQIAGRLEFKNPFEGERPKVDLNKLETIEITKMMYETVMAWILQLSEEQMTQEIDFGGEKMPVWRLFYAMENHIIHHRGQAICYLRLKGITPKGYFGW